MMSALLTANDGHADNKTTFDLHIIQMCRCQTSRNSDERSRAAKSAMEDSKKASSWAVSRAKLSP